MNKLVLHAFHEGIDVGNTYSKRVVLHLKYQHVVQRDYLGQHRHLHSPSTLTLFLATKKETRKAMELTKEAQMFDWIRDVTVIVI